VATKAIRDPAADHAVKPASCAGWDAAEAGAATTAAATSTSASLLTTSRYRGRG
jgi:hypothetical protein